MRSSGPVLLRARVCGEGFAKVFRVCVSPPPPTLDCFRRSPTFRGFVSQLSARFFVVVVGRVVFAFGAALCVGVCWVGFCVFEFQRC